MRTRLSTNSSKLTAVLTFSAIALAALSVATTPTPTGAWANIYVVYPLAWAGLAVTCILTLALIQFTDYTRLPVLALILAVLTVVSMTYAWDLPFGVHDPWVHLNIIANKNVHLGSNVYPSSHILGVFSGSVLGLSPQTVVTRATALIVVLGSLFLYTALRSTSSAQPALIALIASTPAILLIRSRPFSLTIIFVPLLYVLLFRTYDRRSLALMSFLTTLLLFLHPFVAFISLVIITCGILSTKIVDHDQLSPITVSQSPTTAMRAGGAIVVLTITIITYLVFVTQIGTETAASVFVEFIADTSSTAGGVGSSGGVGSAGGQSLIAKFFSTRQHFLEGLTRLSYVLVIATIATISALIQARRRTLSSTTVASLLAFGGVSGTFITMNILAVHNIGLPRILLIAPFLLIPSLAPFCRASDTRPAYAVGVGALILLAASTGVLVSYDTPATTGGVQLSATQSQLAAIDHLHDHRGDAPVIGGRMTAWVVQGQYGYETLNGWGPYGNLKIDTYNRPGRYAWQAGQRPPDSLYMIAGADQAAARYDAAETGSNVAICMEQFIERTNRVYANGDSTIQRVPTQIKQKTCPPVK